MKFLSAIFLSLTLAKSWADSPWLSLLGKPDLVAPPDFATEMRAGPHALKLPAPVGISMPQLEIEREELVQALDAQGTPAAERDSLISEYLALRKLMTGARPRVLSEFSVGTNVPHFDPESVSTNLPLEFRAYCRAGIHYLNGDIRKAVGTWRRILQLPPEQRQYRSTWSAFMAGRVLDRVSPYDSVELLGEVRQLQVQGFRDPLDFARRSAGHEAALRLRSRDMEGAVGLLAALALSGDFDALGRLMALGNSLMRDSSESSRLAVSPVMRRVAVLAAFDEMESGSGSELSGRVIDAFLHAESTDDPYLPWLSAASGRWTIARQSLEKFPADSPIANWLRCKVWARDGRISDARSSIESALANSAGLGRFTNYFIAELASLHLAEGRFNAALLEFLRTQFRADAAYLAEQVLDVDELVTFAAQNAGAPTWLRHLLARRLARDGRWVEAEPFFPPEIRDVATHLGEQIRIGRDARQPAPTRAAALADAAQILRRHGKELIATALDPDWALARDSFAAMPIGEIRRLGFRFEAGKRIPLLPAPTSAETKRYRRNAPKPVHRFHYRFEAAELAWEAAALMPSRSDETAAILVLGGSWIKDLDPRAANRFYRALVLRCPNTALGRAAAKRHWFPRVAATL